MISLEARMIRGKNYCIVRAWDGYDKPEYFKQFKITDEEVDFIGGRFKKMKWIKGIYLKPFKIPSDEHQLKHIVEWLSVNTSKSFYITIEDYLEPFWMIYITEFDAPWFYLKWGEYIV